MNSKLMYWPAIAMVALTFVVWVRMFVTRIGEMRRERIHPQSVATSAHAAAKFKQTQAADNFRNLFEMPVLFYLAIVVAVQSGQVTLITLILAWLYVLLRVGHSAIQCSYNRVMHRFQVYLTSGIVLAVLWIWLAFGLLQ